MNGGISLRSLLAVLTFSVLLGGMGFWWSRRAEPGWNLSAGDYELSLHATRGSRRGRTVQGPLVLVPTSQADRSPRTGQIARDHDIRYTPLYGWLEADLREVGAPLCPDGPAPPPASRDPVFPGVLVLAVDPEWKLETRVKRPPDAPILAIGTSVNMRDGRTHLDGCGIGLFVQTADRVCLRGEWSEFGLQYDGAGSFSLCEGRR